MTTLFTPMNLNDYAKRINQTAREHGFWPEEGRNFGEMIALMHSELSEALEEHRSKKPNVWHLHPDLETGIAKPEGVAVELADCLIRILDTMHSLGVDIDAVVQEKMAYNDSRPHKHGKAY